MAGSTVALTNDYVNYNLAQGGSGGSGGSNAGTGGRGGDGQGGGLYMAGGTVTLTNDTVDGDRALGGNGGIGGTGRSASLGGKGHSGNGGDGGDAFGGSLYEAGGTVLLTNDQLGGSGQGGSGGSGGYRGAVTSKAGFNGGDGGGGGAGRGGSLYVASGSLTLTNDFLQNGRVVSGDGGYGAQGDGPDANGGNGGTAGEAMGGFLYVADGTVTLTQDQLDDYYAQGGFGGSGGSDSGTPAVSYDPKKGFQYRYGKGGDAGAGGDAFGGGLYVADGAVTLAGDTFFNNFARGGSGGSGNNGGRGGVGGTGVGGVLDVAGGTVTLTNDTLQGNAAYGEPGGYGGNGGHATTLGGGEPGGVGGVGGNGMGGGLFVASGSTTLTNDTLSGNSAQGGVGGNGGNGSGDSKVGKPGGGGGNGGSGMGGGLYFFSGTLTLANTLIAQDSVTPGNGGKGGTGNVGNAFSGSLGSASGPDFSGTVTSSDHDLIGNTSGSSGFSASNGDVLNVNPDLGPLTNNSGFSDGYYPLTMALLPGSPAIDAGNNNAPGVPATDQRGYARIVDGGHGNAIDIGTYEYGATAATTDLSVTGNGPPTISPSGQITYNLTVTNNSPTDQSNVTLADVLPANTTLASWTPAAGWSSSAPAVGSGSGTVSAWIASLGAGASANFTLVVQVNSSTANGTVLSDTASVGPVIGDPNPANNSVTFTTTVTGPVDVSSDVTVTRGGFHYSFVLHEFVQTLTITNIGTTDLSGPLALQLTSLSSNATLANPSGTVSGDPYIDFVTPGASLAAGKSITVTLYFKNPTYQTITYGTKVLQGI